MRKLSLIAALLPTLALLAGCPKKNADGADAGDEAAAAPVAVVVDAAPAAPAAKNAADVARFPAEKPLTDDDAKTVEAFTQAKTGPKTGSNVAVLRAGTDPFKIAEFQDCFLVTFPDPKDATSTLMGWIPKAAFTVNTFDAGIRDAGRTDAAVVVVDAAAVNPFALLKCAAGQEAVVNVVGAGAACRKKCTADKDCRTPSVNACAPATTQIGHITKVCANEAP